MLDFPVLLREPPNQFYEAILEIVEHRVGKKKKNDYIFFDGSMTLLTLN